MWGEQAWIWTLLGVLLFVNAVSDIRRKQVCLLLMIWPVPVFCYLEYRCGQGWRENFVLSLFVIVLLLGLRYVTGNQIGAGDAIMLGVTNLALGFWYNCMLLILSLALACVWGGILLAFRKAGKRTEIPFVPCMFLGYLLVLMEVGERVFV